MGGQCREVRQGQRLQACCLGRVRPLGGPLTFNKLHKQDSSLLALPTAALKALLNLVPLLVAVSGRVFSDKPYKTELPNEPKECAIVQARPLQQLHTGCAA